MKRKPKKHIQDFQQTRREVEQIKLLEKSLTHLKKANVMEINSVIAGCIVF